jgi:hypothetical protein
MTGVLYIRTQSKLMKKLLFLSFMVLVFAGTVNAQSDTAFKQLVGTYTFPDGSVVAQVTVAWDEQTGLTMSSSAGTSDLKKLGTDTFSIVTFEGTAVFKRNNEKKVIGVIIDARGYLLEGVRSEPAVLNRRISTKYEVRTTR